MSKIKNIALSIAVIAHCNVNPNTIKQNLEHTDRKKATNDFYQVNFIKHNGKQKWQTHLNHSVLNANFLSLEIFFFVFILKIVCLGHLI